MTHARYRATVIYTGAEIGTRHLTVTKEADPETVRADAVELAPESATVESVEVIPVSGGGGEFR